MARSMIDQGLTLEEKLRAYSVVDEATGCWIWQRNTTGPGYGVLWLKGLGRKALTHRLSYEVKHGPIPHGLYVLHRCDVSLCCNPDHLFVGTHADNMRDMREKGRRLKTHCIHGHPFVEDNIYRGSGRRYCRTCALAWQKAHRARLKERAA